MNSVKFSEHFAHLDLVVVAFAAGRQCVVCEVGCFFLQHVDEMLVYEEAVVESLFQLLLL